MGLLDDAIREHLELKRRHGADPGEVAKQEHEALGPVRRSEAATAPGAVQEEPLSPEHEQLLAPDDAWEPEEEELAAEAMDTEAEPSPEPGPAVDDDEPENGSRRLRDEPGQDTVSFSLSDLEEEEAQEAPPAEVPEDEEPVRRRQRAEPLPPADVVPADEEPADEDVLEETPEFLQETPEHDRLWFEQKPPRDFDF
jgi:hypothetical protein